MSGEFDREKTEEFQKGLGKDLGFSVEDIQREMGKDAERQRVKAQITEEVNRAYANAVYRVAKITSLLEDNPKHRNHHYYAGFISASKMIAQDIAQDCDDLDQGIHPGTRLEGHLSMLSEAFREDLRKMREAGEPEDRTWF